MVFYCDLSQDETITFAGSPARAKGGRTKKVSREDANSHVLKEYSIVCTSLIFILKAIIVTH